MRASRSGLVLATVLVTVYFGCSTRDRAFNDSGGGGTDSGSGAGSPHGSGAGAGGSSTTNSTSSAGGGCPACDDGDPCNGIEQCDANGACVAGVPLLDGAACKGGKICVGQKCTISTCGDGYRDAAGGEECDPPDGTTCDASCKLLGCGDGKLGPGEDCDDANNKNLDGCDTTCHFEEELRINSLSMSFGADIPFCQKNVLGGAIVYSQSQTLINSGLTDGVNSGLSNIIFKTIGMTDASGQSDQSFQIGVVYGKPAAGPSYSGANDLDWWYVVDPNAVDGARQPLNPMSASITSGTLTAGPGSFTGTWALDTVTSSQLTMANARISATVGPASAPTASATGGTPGHLASEALNPALTTLQSLSNGKLCGSMTALTLSGLPVPQSAVSYCSGFTPAHNMLDLIVAGCIYNPGIAIVLVSATQPDGSTTGSTFTFQVDAAHHVTGCTKDGTAQPGLTGCLTDATFSSLFTFTADRVIVR